VRRAALRFLIATVLISQPAQAQRRIVPGDSALRPTRVRLGTDTIVVLVAPPGAAAHLSSVLVRTTTTQTVNGRPIFRETQRYDSHEPARPGITLDTLDVDAASLQPLRNVFWSSGSSFQVRFEGLRFTGSQVVADSAPRVVEATAGEAFFHSMMFESFIGAMPIAPSLPVQLPFVNPPTSMVRTLTLQVDSMTTIQTANGPERCYLVRATPGNTQLWLSVRDGHLMRLHFSAPDGTSIWKLPQRDTAFVAGMR
jgi:hypothetical protein